MNRIIAYYKRADDSIYIKQIQSSTLPDNWDIDSLDADDPADQLARVILSAEVKNKNDIDTVNNILGIAKNRLPNGPIITPETLP